MDFRLSGSHAVLYASLDDGVELPRWEGRMFLAIVSVACMGILLGLWLRAASVLAASLVLAVASTVFLPLLTEWSPLKAAGFFCTAECAAMRLPSRRGYCFQ